MRIFYAYYEKKSDYAFIVKWNDVKLGKNYVLMFDCYNDKWREAAGEVIRAPDIMNTVDPVDLKMAGGYIDLQDDKVDFPEDIKREFIKFTFNTEIRKNT